RWIRDDGTRGVSSPTRSVRRMFVAVPVALALAAAAAVLMWPRRSPAPAALVQFEGLPPPGASFAESSAFLARSPDGKMLAFAANRDGHRGLWVRPLDSSTSRLVEGTEGAGQPFWSADSRYVGFWAAGKLRKVDVVEGGVLVLADVPLMQSGT